MSTPPLTLPDRLKSIKERMKISAEKSRRNAESVCLVAVGKTVSPDLLLGLPDLGVRHLAENKVQEAVTKREALLNQPFTHHFIGHLQTNKARKALELFDMIQTVDRPRLAEFLDHLCFEMGKTKRCLIEVKVSNEPTKSGIPISEAKEFISTFSKFKNLRLEGLMTIGAFGISQEETRDCFRTFAKFCEEQKKYLGPKPLYSFGMSDDFEVAIEEGSNMVRIGRALFGERAK